MKQRKKVDTDTVVGLVLTTLTAVAGAVVQYFLNRNQLHAECSEIGTEIVNSMIEEANKLNESSNEDEETK